MLIITCPCALGLAVPMVQVVAARRLFESGIMVKDGGALERLAEIDTVIFDKTGTLTLDRRGWSTRNDDRPRSAGASRRRSPRIPAIPIQRRSAAAAETRPVTPVTLDRRFRTSGRGLRSRDRHDESTGSAGRTGRWRDAAEQPTATIAGVVLSENGDCARHFRFDERLSPGCPRGRDRHRASRDAHVEILSGDRDEPVRHLASGSRPSLSRGRLAGADKTAHIVELTQAGQHVLMVGDGLNDAPALAAAHASMAPATAADVGRNAADFVFLHDSLLAVPQALAVARDARQLVRQNLIARHRLQRHRGADRHPRPCDAAYRGDRDVGLVAAGDRQCLALERLAVPARIHTRRRARWHSPRRPCDGESPMTDFFYLIPIALALGAIGLGAFMWSLRKRPI